MFKYIYLIRGSSAEDYKEFKKRIFKTAESFTGNFDQLKLTLSELAPPAVSIIPFKKKKIAAISVYANKEPPASPVLKDVPGFSGSYQVTEALPVAYKKNWQDGQKTPGVCLLTLFRKKKSIDYQTFIHRWHEGHTPLSLRVHPLWHYNRNEVTDQLSTNSEYFNGIVEEHCRTRSELMNPFKFFGNPFIIIPRMLNVYFDVKSFIDYSSIEPYLVTEYHIKS